MNSDLARAAENILRRFARQKATVDPAVRQALEEIEAGLFDFDFSASQLTLSRSPGDVTAFRKAIGFNPRDYLALARTLIAARLLCETDLNQETISQLVGIRATNTLRHYFYRFFKCRPGKVRSTFRSSRQAALPTMEGYCRWRDGVLDSQTAAEMANRLDCLDSEQGRPIPTVSAVIELSEDEDILELEVRVLLRHSREERLRLLRRGAFQGTERAFDALSRLSRSEGRKNRNRGVELAELALSLAEGNVERWGKDYLALGWARLGNALRVASDLDGAESAIARADSWAKEAHHGHTKAELLCLKGALRLFQRRIDEASEILNEGIALCRAAGTGLLLADALFQRASLRLYRGEPDEAVPDLTEARRLVPVEDKRRQLIAVFSLVDAAILSGDKERARELLPDARRLTGEASDNASSLQIQWLEGLLLREDGKCLAAEPLLKRARSGFIELEDLGMTAIVSLELALLFHEQGGRTTEVMSYASNALPALEALRIPEALAAHALLKQAIAERRFHRSILELARRRILAPGAR